MGKRIFGTVLLMIALFMLVGFLNAQPAVGALARLLAFLIAVILPAAGGLYLWWSAAAEGAAYKGRREKLRRQTLESELLRLAERHGGKLTVVEAVAELAFDAATVEKTLNAMAENGLAEIELTDSGVLVYAFYDVRHLGEKSTAKGVLDA